MAFFRFSRDKRGYEYFYLVEPVTSRKGKSRQRVLYWYRTPPNVRVGRAPFDDEVRRALEAQYPEITFDWAKIVEAPIPSADAEKWRERRRTERAERAARRSTSAETADEEIAATDGLDSDLAESDSEPDTGETPLPVDSADQSGAAAAAVDDAPAIAARAPGEASERRRRRRRRGGGDHVARQQSTAATADTVQPPAAGQEPQAMNPPDDSTESSGE